MENQLVFLDTGILIDIFRKRVKRKAHLFKLAEKNYQFAVSIIAKYEILVGSKDPHTDFWNEFFDRVLVIPFDDKCCQEAIYRFQILKLKNKLIPIEDLFIGSSAIAFGLPIATLNRKHFERFENLDMVDL